jgi:peptide-methionine (S)-S-oxide reductase
MFGLDPFKRRMPTAEEALPGREQAMAVVDRHAVLGSSTVGPWPGMAQVTVGMGCFWGAERIFWTAPGVISTQVGYAAGFTPNPTYQELCSGRTGHNEVVRVVFDPAKTSLGAMLTLFWEGHDPTSGMRQGNDVGTQYRSGIYLSDPGQRAEVEASRAAFGQALRVGGHGAITTEILDPVTFHFAEDQHQQYLHKNPGGYCGLGGTGVSCPVGVG